MVNTIKKYGLQICVSEIILLALVSVFAFSSCKGEEICRSELSEGRKQLIPYEKGQVISFIDIKEQVIDLTVTESKMEWWQIKKDGFTDDYSSTQVKSVTLKSISGNIEISLEINADGCFSDGGYSMLDISINNNWGIVLLSDTEGNLWTDSNTSFHKSIEINGNVYYDVFEQKIDAAVHYGEYFPSKQLFYNKTYGILQINRDGKNFLTLNPKTDEGKENKSLDVIDCLDFPLADPC